MLTFFLAGVPAPMPFVSPMFSDHMVLQRNMRDPIWGWTTPGTKVKVTIDGKSSTAVAGSDGKWSTTIGPLKVGGPYTLTIDGPQSVSFSDILAGDVWICSGQSNMEFGVGNLLDPSAVAAAADHPNLRLFVMPKTIATSPLPFNPAPSWSPCTPQTIASMGTWSGFSAVGYFFGAKLQSDENVPIGLLQTSWGGTPAEAWTREQELESFASYKAQLSQLDAFNASQAANQSKDPAQRLAEWYQKYDAGTSGNWQNPLLDDSSWKTTEVPEYFQKSGMAEFNNNQSVVWYRKSIDIPAEVASAGTTLHLKADDNDIAYINGVQVGATDGVQATRAYKIPAGTLKAGANVFVFRITDTGQPGGIFGDPSTFYLQSDTGISVPLGGSWKIKLGAAVTSSNPFPGQMDQDPQYPTALYNGMIAPIAPLSIKGAIWYQGESNASFGRSEEYNRLLPTMINSWRNTFKQGEFPFLIVQLAGYGHAPANPGNDAWAEVREAEAMTPKRLAHTGMASAVDVGQENDIHPKDKKTVGERLAAVAEDQVYGKHVIDSGPTYRSMKVIGSSIEVSFDHVDQGLQMKGSGQLFMLAGADHKWYWADGKIEGNKVIVSSPSVPKPIAVRYYWANYLPGNIVDGAGWPMIPFRSDNWKDSLGMSK